MPSPMLAQIPSQIYSADDVVSPTYEYGWVFMVVSGLLNALVILDARDLALGRKDVA